MQEPANLYGSQYSDISKDRLNQFPVGGNTAAKIIRTKDLVSIFERKFNFSNSKATKLARFFVEGPPLSSTDAEIEDKDHAIDHESLINRFRDHI